MDESIAEKEKRGEIERLLNTAKDYLWRAKVNKEKDAQNFEVMLAFEYVTNAKDKSKKLMHVKEFYEDANRRADAILDELRKLRLTFRVRKSAEEMEYEQGDVGGG